MQMRVSLEINLFIKGKKIKLAAESMVGAVTARSSFATQDVGGAFTPFLSITLHSSFVLWEVPPHVAACTSRAHTRCSLLS